LTLPSVQLGTAHLLRFSWQLDAVQQLLLMQSLSTLQEKPAPHRCGAASTAQPPPQSGPVSLPFGTASVHVGARQVLLIGLHTLLAQSESATHFWPGVQRVVQVTPPQLTSVSLPFCTASKQLGESQSLVLGLQTLLSQSVALVHGEPGGQGVQLPPQSTPLSVGSFTPLLQVGAWHSSAVQFLNAQSSLVVQAAPFAQRCGTASSVTQGPPQSVPVSAPFLIPSLQLRG
jgi:hypothetical protein